MKRLLALLLVMLMIFSLTACSSGKKDDPKTPGGDDTEDPGGDNEEPGGDTEEPGGDTGKDLLDGEFFVLEDQTGVFSVFKEFSFTYNTDNKDNEDESYTYSHKYLDSEVVDYELDGESHSDNAKHFQVTLTEDGQTSVFEAWVNEAGTIVKAGSKEEGYGTGDSAALKCFGFIFHLIPFYAYNESFSEVFTKDGFAGLGWQVREHSQGSKDFGAGNVRIDKYIFGWSWTEDTFTWEIAKIKSRYVFTQWKIIGDDETLEMIVARVIPF